MSLGRQLLPQFSDSGKTAPEGATRARTIPRMTTRITARDVANMTEHWLGTPVNGYLGSSYGSDTKSLLQTPMAAGLADGLVAKCRQDVPILLGASSDAINVYAYDADHQTKVIAFDISGELVEVDNGGDAYAPEGSEDGLALSPEPELIDLVNVDIANGLHYLLHVTLPTPGYL